MIRKLSVQLTDGLIYRQYVDESDKDIYVFGIETMLLYAVNLCTILVLALLMNQLWECFLFMLLFLPLRKNAGGYHASTQFKCYMISNGVTVLVLMSLRNLTASIAVEYGLIILLVMSASIVLYAPIDCSNKPLDSLEKKVYRRRTRVILALEFVFCLLCVGLDIKPIFWLINLAITVEALSLYIGLLKTKLIVI